MPLPRDAETLKIPAYMRRRSLSARARKPLVLTALDRKQAGVMPEGLKPRPIKRKRPAHLKAAAPRASMHAPLPQDLFSTFIKPAAKPKNQRKVASKPVRKAVQRVKPAKILEAFLPPIIEEPADDQVLGVITHFYPKISVGVIKLSGTLEVGDKISYKTTDGTICKQIIKSMEINRSPVFSAKSGDDIGVKLKQAAELNTQIQLAR